MPGANEAQLQSLLKAWQAQGLFTHAYVATGLLTPEARPVLEASILPDGRDIFDLASLTKALVTTPAALRLTGQGEWLMDQPIANAPLILKNPSRFADIPAELLSFTPGDLLRHESGLPPWRNFYVECAGLKPSPLRVIEQAAQHLEPGKNRYSDVGFLLLGILLERSYEANFKGIFDLICADFHYLSPPSQQLSFGPDLSAEDRLRRAIPTGPCAVRGRDLVGEVWDENAWALGGRCAHAGLFGTGPALSAFLCSMARSMAGRALIKQQALQIGGLENESLLGWRQGNDPAARVFGDGFAMGHLGFTGTAFWMTAPDAKTKPGSYAIVLTNRVISGRINSLIRDFRKEVLSLFWQAL